MRDRPRDGAGDSEAGARSDSGADQPVAQAMLAASPSVVSGGPSDGFDDIARLKALFAGQYRIEREVGRGGMAAVYLAEDLKHHRSVAVKVLRPSLSALIALERFLLEIETAARLRHPHILPLHDSGSIDGTFFYVMPFVPGESLYDKLRREGPLSIEEATRLAREIADGLSYAHSQGVVHRDIKPNNIMLESNHAVISDFGIALVAKSLGSERVTESGIQLGTPKYMSPEQSTGGPEIDGRTDIYSLGCVLYEMLVGEPPFTGPTPQAILAKKLKASPTRPRLLRDSVPRALERVILRALSRNPADRFRTAEEFGQALADVGIGGRERPVGRADDSRARRRRATGERSGTSSDSRISAVKVVGFVAAAVAMLTAIGFLTTLVHDVKLGIPSQYTPSRIDFPIAGLRAMVAPVFTALVLLIGFTAVRQVVKLVFVAFRRWRWYRPPESTRYQKMLNSIDPVTIAEVWFLLSIVASVVVIRPFWPLINSFFTTDTTALSCAARSTHLAFTEALTALVTVLSLGTYWVFRWVSSPLVSGLRLTLTRWGSVAWILVLVLTVGAPWELLWSQNPRALLDGEAVYIIREQDAELLLYNPRTKATENHHLQEIPGFKRLPLTGYLFEDPKAFFGTQPGC